MVSRATSADSEASLLGFHPPNCDIGLKREEGTLGKLEQDLTSDRGQGRLPGGGDG